MKPSQPLLSARWMPLFLAVVAAGLIAAVGPAEPGATSGPSLAKNRFIGADKCKNCHQAESAGHQFAAWESSKHAQAYKTLASDKAKEFGAVHGIDDPQQSDQCLKCHVTAFGQDAAQLNKSFKPERGVQCESCHGPGERHFKARLAAAFDDEDEDEFAEEGDAGHTAIPESEIIKRPAAASCLECHNSESPAYKPFCFCESMPKIRHLNPTKPRTPEELAALETCTKNAECQTKHGCDGTACKVESR